MSDNDNDGDASLADMSSRVSAHNLTPLYADTGQHTRAEYMLMVALQGYELKLGPDHILTLDAVHNLGSLCADQGRYREAEERYKRALRGFDKVLGPEHESTLSAVNNLGLLYMDQGRYQDAEAMYQRTLRYYESSLGPDDTATLSTINNLGLILKNQHRYVEAEARLLRALRGYEVAWGPEHTVTLSTANNLGLLYAEDKRYKDAELMFSRVLKGYEAVLGPEHISTLSTLNNLGLIYSHQGRYEEAEASFGLVRQGYANVPRLDDSSERRHFPSLYDLAEPLEPRAELEPTVASSRGVNILSHDGSVGDVFDVQSLQLSLISGSDGIFDAASMSVPTAPTAPHSQSALTEYLNDLGVDTGLGMHVSDFALELYDRLGADSMDAETRARAAGMLPELLKHYAMMIGYGSQTQAHRDIMFLVYKYRSRIAGHFGSLNMNPALPIMDEKTEMFSPMERLKRWMHDLEPLDAGGQASSAERRIDRGPDESSASTAAASSLSSEDGDEGVEEATFSYELLRSQAHQTLAIDGEPFDWLLCSLRRSLETHQSSSATMAAIRKTVSDSLEFPRTVSRRSGSQAYKASFLVQWDLPRFLRDQLFNHDDPVKALSKVITITGTDQDAQAMTSEQYLSQTWPVGGNRLLRHLEALLARGNDDAVTSTLGDGTELTTCFKGEELSVEVHGTSASVLDVGQQLAWLGAALRASPDPEKLSYCTPSILTERRASEGSKFLISFKTEEIRSNQRGLANGLCWHGLFRNPTVVKGYPIRGKVESNSGLEMPLRVMAALVGSRQIDTFNNQTFIKGFSKLLVPVRTVQETIYWHMYRSQNDEMRISYACRTASHAGYIDNVQLQEARHILGWSLDAEFCAGSSQASYDIRNSFLESPDMDSILAGIHMAPASYLNGGPKFVVCRKDTGLSLTVGRIGHRKRLKWLSKEMVLLWDTAEKRGWLINGLSALLHLVRASLEKDRTDPFSDGFLFKPEDLQKADELTADSAALVLMNQSNLKLKLYEKQEEEEEDGDDQDDNVDEDDETFEDRVKLLYGVLEKLIDCQKLVAGDNGANLIGRPRRQLEGWDFDDLVMKNDDRVYSRITSLDPAGMAWVDLVRLVSAVTLFGHGFGDIIRPSLGTTKLCSEWRVLPPGRSYIATCLSDIRHWINTTGGASHTRLGRRLVWHTETNLFESCTGDGDSSKQDCLEPVQSLLPNSMSNEVTARKSSIPTSAGAGAVIFGHHSRAPMIWDEDNPQNANSIMMNRGLGLGLTMSPVSGTASSSTGSMSRGSMSRQTESITSQSWSFDGLDELYAPERTRSRDSYTIGIICALSRELKAVRLLLDQTFPRLGKVLNDDNVYELGRMGRHLVVATCLPARNYGTNAAAVCAGDMRRSFGKMEFCFLVGVGGGVPSAVHDIRLGDVVVGQRTADCPAVIQYDLGKEKDEEEGGFESTGGSNMPNPPTHVLNAISYLQSDPFPRPDPLRVYMEEIAGRVSLEDAARYRYLGADRDMLTFDSGADADTTTTIRPPRATDSPVVHYGPIASGNRVIKSARFRDALAERYGILCFEMEAAGVVNSLPTLVVRGICDYSDARKDKDWQDYAAASAASYVKLLLSVMPSAE